MSGGTRSTVALCLWALTATACGASAGSSPTAQNLTPSVHADAPATPEPTTSPDPPTASLATSGTYEGAGFTVSYGLAEGWEVGFAGHESQYEQTASNYVAIFKHGLAGIHIGSVFGAWKDPEGSVLSATPASVDEAIDALQANEGLELGPAQPAELGGLSGQRMEVTAAPERAHGDMGAHTEGRTTDTLMLLTGDDPGVSMVLLPQDVADLWLLQHGDQVIFVALTVIPELHADALREAEPILESLRFE